MDKLKLAHEMALAIQSMKLIHDMELVFEMAWKYADAMQAEADKRECKERPDVLKEEWQHDWSQAPEWANYIAVYSDYCNASYFEKEPKIISGYTWGGTDGKSLLTPVLVYAGNWKESLRKRPEALCEVDWGQAPRGAAAYMKLSAWDIGVWIDDLGFQINDAPTFGFTGSHVVERPHGF